MHPEDRARVLRTIGQSLERGEHHLAYRIVWPDNHAHTVSLRLEEVAGRVVLEVRGDGVGFVPNTSYPGHFGLTSMRERAAACGGQLTIDSEPGRGVRLTLKL